MFWTLRSTETFGWTRAVPNASGPRPLSECFPTHALPLMLLLSGCLQIAQTSEAATPPAEQPAYAALAAKYFSSTMADPASFENFEISGLRWVHAFKGWSWLACVHFVDHGRLRSYALF